MSIQIPDNDNRNDYSEQRMNQATNAMNSIHQLHNRDKEYIYKESPHLLERQYHKSKQLPRMEICDDSPQKTKSIRDNTSDSFYLKGQQQDEILTPMLAPMLKEMQIPKESYKSDTDYGKLISSNDDNN